MPKIILVTIDGVRLCDILENSIMKNIINRGLFFPNIKVTNRIKLSYPCYSEMLTGKVDPLVVTNRPLYNPNKTIVEKLMNAELIKPNEILIASSWAYFTYIYNSSRSGIKPINWDLDSNTINNKKSGFNCGSYKYKTLPERYKKKKITHDVKVYRQFKYAYLKNKKKNKFSHLALALTDHYGHRNTYYQYTNHLNLAGEIILDILGYLDNQTTLIIATDHGRGTKDFKDHNANIPGSEFSWAIIIGPNIEKNIDNNWYSLGIIHDLIQGIFLKD